MRFKNIVKSVIIIGGSMAFVACSSAPKGLISSSADPRQEIDKMSADMILAQESNIDVLARKDYLKSSKYLKEAKEDLADDKKQEEVIDDLRYARQYLKSAYETAGNRQEKAPGLFSARQSAIKAGANESSRLKLVLVNIDEDIADKADEIDKISPEDLDQLQARYVELERDAVVERQLGKAKAQINGARSEGAAKMAPLALRSAEIVVKNAESLIGSNVSNPSVYNRSVIRANAEAAYLSEVVDTVKGSETPLSESTAAKIVAQRRQIAGLKEDLTLSEGEVSSVESTLDSKNKALAERGVALEKKDMALDAAQANIAIQNAMEKSRQQFSADEAEAYQQGGNLLIRLKAINFKSGRSELPTESIALLAKVSEVAKSLNAKEIMVEGHTDSIGTNQANKALSEQRAKTVATYFKSNGFEGTEILSEGHSFENPIASNKSKDGRAQNRRVDIIITPDSTSVISQ